MFGKNYDEDIKYIKKVIEAQGKQIIELMDFIKTNQKWIENNQKQMIEIAKVQVSHKKAIDLLAGRV